MEETQVGDQQNSNQVSAESEAFACDLLLMGIFVTLIREGLSLGFPRRRGKVTNLEEVDTSFLYRLPFTP
ncbi:MAG: hypothetical protein ACM3O9_06415 [Methylocystaceae bacterium]